MTPTPRDAPAPLEADDVRIVALGTAVWVLALIACLVLRGSLAERGHQSWVWVALAGVFLGLVGLRYVVRRRAALRRAAHSPPSP